MDIDSAILGLTLGIVAGIAIDRWLLAPLVLWHARLARHGRR